MVPIFDRERENVSWRYLGSLLNLCVTVAAFPLHFSHEYSISSIWGEKGVECVVTHPSAT